MEFIRVKSTVAPQFGRMWEIYSYSFPYAEMRELEHHKQILKDDRCNFVAIEQDGVTVGMLLYWIFLSGERQYIYLEYLATARELRNGGLGRIALDYLKGYAMPILLEIEPPEDELTQRRRRFYERSGFILNVYCHKHSPYHINCEAEELKIMSYPELLSPQAYSDFSRAQQEIMPIFIAAR